jgi:hypothetical protein
MRVSRRWRGKNEGVKKTEGAVDMASVAANWTALSEGKKRWESVLDSIASWGRQKGRGWKAIRSLAHGDLIE